jgi:hypothetical protein
VRDLDCSPPHIEKRRPDGEGDDPCPDGPGEDTVEGKHGQERPEEIPEHAALDAVGREGRSGVGEDAGQRGGDGVGELPAEHDEAGAHRGEVVDALLAGLGVERSKGGQGTESE